MPIAIDELDDEMIQWVIDHLEASLGDVEKRRQAMFEAYGMLEDEEEKIRAKIKLLESKREAAAQKLVHAPSGRVKRGVTEKMVEEFLRQRNGEGATLNEIKDATGTKYATVRRIITELSKSAKVQKSEDLRWHWKSGGIELFE